MEDEEESRTRRSKAKPSKSIVKDVVSNDKIYESEIKKQTLNPIWNQTFILWVRMCVFAACQVKQVEVIFSLIGFFFSV